MSRKLADDQIREVAQKAGVEYAALKAVALVESGGSGFICLKLSDGRRAERPVILLERHLVWRRLKARQIDPVPLATALPPLCGQTWDPKRHPYGTKQKQWEKVQSIIDWAKNHAPQKVESFRKAAWEACSWGMFQLLGMNYEGAGFPDVDMFAQAHSESEGRQLEAIVRWMQNRGILDELKRRDWEAFARAYNGPGQVDLYASRLEGAYLRVRSNG